MDTIYFEWDIDSDDINLLEDEGSKADGKVYGTIYDGEDCFIDLNGIDRPVSFRYFVKLWNALYPGLQLELDKVMYERDGEFRKRTAGPVEYNAEDDSFWDKEQGIRIRPLEDVKFNIQRGEDDQNPIEHGIGYVSDEYKALISKEHEMWKHRGDPNRPPEAGAYKVTFFYNNYVRKVPTSLQGQMMIEQEMEEIDRVKGFIPVALTEMDGSVMVQEELQSMYEKIMDDPNPWIQKEPWLKLMEDGPQAGIDSAGKLKAYDGWDMMTTDYPPQVIIDMDDYLPWWAEDIVPLVEGETDSMFEKMMAEIEKDIQFAQNKQAGMTRNKYLELASGLPEDTSEVIYDFGDGWTVRKLNTFGDARREGVLMSNCINPIDPSCSLVPDEVDQMEYPEERDYWLQQNMNTKVPWPVFSLRDQDNLPQLTLDNTGLSGRHNSSPKPHLIEKLEEWLELDGTHDDLEQMVGDYRELLDMPKKVITASSIDTPLDFHQLSQVVAPYLGMPEKSEIPERIARAQKNRGAVLHATFVTNDTKEAASVEYMHDGYKNVLYDKENDFVTRSIGEADPDEAQFFKMIYDGRSNDFIPLLLEEFDRWKQFGDPTRKPSTGSTRSTFFYNGYIRKVPLNKTGLDQNIRDYESFNSEETEVPMARLELDNNSVLIQEEVEDLFYENWYALTEKHPWIKKLDDGPQVGYDAGGEVRVYDGYRDVRRGNIRRSNVLDPVQEELDQRVFDGITPRAELFDPYLQRMMRSMKEAGFNPNAFDFFFNGSLTTYQYGPGSDVDISIISTEDDFIDEDRAELVKIILEHDGELLSDDIQYPLQHFVQPPGVTMYDLFGAGVKAAYNLKTKKWLIVPNKDRTLDVEGDYPDWLVEAVQVSDKVLTLLEGGFGDEAFEVYKDLHRKRKEAYQIDRANGDFTQANVNYKYLDKSGVRGMLREAGYPIGV